MKKPCKVSTPYMALLFIFLKKGIKIALKYICQRNEQSGGGIAVPPLYLTECAGANCNSYQLKSRYNIYISQMILLSKPLYIHSDNRLFTLHNFFLFHTYSVCKNFSLKFLKWTQM